VKPRSIINFHDLQSSFFPVGVKEGRERNDILKVYRRMGKMEWKRGEQQRKEKKKRKSALSINGRA
jgi:hypothetical protein